MYALARLHSRFFDLFAIYVGGLGLHTGAPFAGPYPCEILLHVCRHIGHVMSNALDAAAVVTEASLSELRHVGYFVVGLGDLLDSNSVFMCCVAEAVACIDQGLAGVLKGDRKLVI